MEGSGDSAGIEIEVVGEQISLRIPDGKILLTGEQAQKVSSQLLEAVASSHGEDSEELDSKRVHMQYLRMGVEEESESEDVEPKVAVIHCWIKNQTRTNALHVACGWIGDDGWFVTELIEQRAVSRADFENDEALQYYEQALIDDEVFLYEIDGGENDEEGSTDGE